MENRKEIPIIPFLTTPRYKNLNLKKLIHSHVYDSINKNNALDRTDK